MDEVSSEAAQHTQFLTEYPGSIDPVSFHTDTIKTATQ